ncbi:MAG: T9SS type A sorting domain-containing protein [Candidatus Electryonea clarkiae]|nr:T9SS type A sorting domain-containing protein [Candidatus Electryonea clarkiae]MDP8285207.1 T9SS type A sorting domain-containing protein [Candidatus Electryonea clarkiae]
MLNPNIATEWKINSPHPIYYYELDEIVTTWEDDFEGNDDWTTSDLNVTGDFWHVSDFNAYEDGESWWCGDDDLEGYGNRWLQYIETPELDFSDAAENLELTFRMYLECEESGNEPAGYDGWDGANAWYSEDGGEIWSVLEDPEPAYGSESLYGFGHAFYFGIGIPGWNGDDGGEDWIEVTFDLTDFVGANSFMLRFAFCSDGETSTPETGDLGFFIDEILIRDNDQTYLENDAEENSFPSDLITVEQESNGDVWVLQTNSYHSESHAWQMEHTANLRCVLVSPEIEIPDTTLFPWTQLAYWVRCDMPDSDGDSDGVLEDYYSIDISTDNGDTWERLVYDYGVTDGDGNSLYNWDYRSTGLRGGRRTDNIDLTLYSGETVQIRFTGITDNNDDGGEGGGLLIDDVMLVSDALLENDVAVQPPNIPFPTTVGFPIPARTTFVNRGWNSANFDGAWFIDDEEFLVHENIELAGGESTTFLLDNDPDDNFEGWVPDDWGSFDLFVTHNFGDDDDETNDTSLTVTIDLLPEGQYEFGYDDRNPQWTTTRFPIGDGPASRFVIDEDFYPFDIETIRVLWNNDIDEDQEVEFVIHVLSDPGLETIWSGTYEVDTSQVYPDWQELDLSLVDDLQGLESNFWVWFELTADYAFPHITYSERTVGEGHHFEFDGTEAVDSDADWMIRAVISTDLDEVRSSYSILPDMIVLFPPYPNPFNPSTKVDISLPKAGEMIVAVYNTLGQQVAELAHGHYPAGVHTLTFDTGDLASSVYFIRASAPGEIVRIRKVVLIR